MEVLTTPDAMRVWSRARRADGARIAVVPTMGALHEGHHALVRAARERADRVVVTIFVNPLQFNESIDFDAYPRPVDDDLARCREQGVDAVYAPDPSAMYAPGFQTHVEPGSLADRLEGPVRPGHFTGVLTVVAKLFGATAPDLAVFGRKDFQQLAIVRRMVVDLDMGIEIVGIETVRDPDGLALSSRNSRLGADDRAAATVLSRALFTARDRHTAGERDPGVLAGLVREIVDTEPRARVEYVEVVDASTLTPVELLTDPAVLLIAAWFGGVRLIDNVELVSPAPE